MPTLISVEAYTLLTGTMVVRVSYAGTLRDSTGSCLEALGQRKMVEEGVEHNMVRAYYPKESGGHYGFVAPSPANKKVAPFKNISAQGHVGVMRQQMIDAYHEQRMRGYFLSVVAFVFRILPINQRQESPAHGHKQFQDIE